MGGYLPPFPMHPCPQGIPLTACGAPAALVAHEPGAHGFEVVGLSHVRLPPCVSAPCAPALAYEGHVPQTPEHMAPGHGVPRSGLPGV